MAKRASRCKLVTFHKRGRAIKVKRCHGRKLSQHAPAACKNRLARAVKAAHGHKGKLRDAFEIYNVCRSNPHARRAQRM